jgi:hypothetical protein
MQALELMANFASRTGLTADGPKRRYLWTDAFAVCNFLELARLTHAQAPLTLAFNLIEQVHQVLGQFRTDDARVGWLSGLAEREAREHPTRGGLRIGKNFPERQPGEPFDEEREWNLDGQYFHYLTKWMRTLDQVSRSTEDPRYNRWARELADVAHKSFVYRLPGTGAPRMAWKMSTDLSRPLVPWMGQHDPLDGLVTYLQLQATSRRLATSSEDPNLTAAIETFATLLHATDIRTTDALGLGGLLCDAWRIAQLLEEGALDSTVLLEYLLPAIDLGLSVSLRDGPWREPASLRLAFRELGLAIGLQALGRLQSWSEAKGKSIAGRRLRDQIRAQPPTSALCSNIIAYWLAPEHREAPTWFEHQDINSIMLATSLIPEGFLALAPDPTRAASSEVG